MPTFLITLVSAILFACLSTAASAEMTWQDRILGQVEDPEPMPYTKSRRARRAIAKRQRSRHALRRKAHRRTSRPVRIPVRRYKSYARQGDVLRGLASYYWDPQPVASGGWYNPNALTAAHISLPFGTRVRVTNLRNGRSVIVRINDRGPYIRGRIIDMSRRAATVLRMRKAGVVPVRVDILKLG